MSHIITLELPDHVYQPIERVARATKQPVESLMVTALQASLPSLDGLPANLREPLEDLESLDDEGLLRQMHAIVPSERQRRLSDLLESQSAGTISDHDLAELARLQHSADLLMLSKARAAVLLRFRGNRVPTLAELNQLAIQ